MLADSATVAGAGAVGLLATVVGSFVALWNVKYSAKSKARDAELAKFSTMIDQGTDALNRGLAYSEAANKELRIDMTAALERVDTLERELRESRANEGDCQRRLDLLARQIKRLEGNVE